MRTITSVSHRTINPAQIKNTTIIQQLFLFILLAISLQVQSQISPAYNPGSCEGFRTQTQGGWGADPHGNNNGTYLHNNFDAAFPSGVTIGCSYGNKLVLATAQAVTDFLPSGSTPSVLPAGILTNPGSSYSNVLAGQLVTAVLNVGFDAYDDNFSSNMIKTGDLVIASGTFAGWTMNELITEANNTIGGCNSSYSLSDLNDALTSFNENYDNGTIDKGFLTCTHTCNLNVDGETNNVTCNGNNNGSIDITVTGAHGAVSYLWNDNNISEDRSGLAPGNYSVTVIDASSCKATASFIIEEPKALDISAITVNVTTVNGRDGSIDITVTGGTQPYSYKWNDGSTDEDRNDLSAGKYSVIVTDTNGCSANAEYTLIQPTCNISISSNVTNICCYGGNTGTIDVTVTGNNGSVSYVWNDGDTHEDRSNLTAGTYSVTATDETLCSVTASYVVKQAKKIKVTPTIQNTSSKKKCDGAATLSATGGTAPYTYTWNDGYVGATRSNLCIGVYTITVTDKKGCSTVIKIKITCPSQLAATNDIQNVSVGKPTESFSASVSPNPTKDVVRVTINSVTNTGAIINVMDRTGKLLSGEKITIGAGVNFRTIDLSSYAKGMYILEVTTNTNSQTFKIIVE